MFRLTIITKKNFPLLALTHREKRSQAGAGKSRLVSSEIAKIELPKKSLIP
jgi:hypothetical protein